MVDNDKDYEKNNNNKNKTKTITTTTTTKMTTKDIITSYHHKTAHGTTSTHDIIPSLDFR